MTVETPVNDNVIRIYYSLKDRTTGGVHPDFVRYLEACGLETDINDIRFGLTKQQSKEGNHRNIGVFMNGEGLYDADEQGNESFAVVVDFLLKNSDSNTYLKYADCMKAYLNSLNIGWWRYVTSVSYSLADATKNTRVTLLMIVFLAPVTDGGR